MTEIYFNYKYSIQESKDIAIAQIIKNLEMSMNKKAVAVSIDGELFDLSYCLNKDCTLNPIWQDSILGLKIIRHSAAHILAEAVYSLFDNVKSATGPATETGFYYDFDIPRAFTKKDLVRIEEKMSQLTKLNTNFNRIEISREEAIQLFRNKNETYKLEILDKINKCSVVSLYSNGEKGFTDLCRGPHVPSTEHIKFIKLISVSEVHRNRYKNNNILQRIYGTAFVTKEELTQYLLFLEEYKYRDHRKLGRKLGLFIIEDDVCPGSIIYLHKGAILRSIIEEFERQEHLRRGYQIVICPQMFKVDIWKQSGHFDNYKDHMYFSKVNNELYGIRPMNCIAHMLIYKSSIRSYKELPLRLFEFGTVLRHERSGVLHGLTRVRQFTQDDAHIMCTQDQLEIEISNVLDFIFEIMSIFGFEYEIEFSSRPEKSIGTNLEWDLASNVLITVLKNKNLSYRICKGEGAFYGPKIDIKLKDVLKRRWQCSTIQCDFTLPKRFELSYITNNGRRDYPMMLHRVILGSLERFIGILIEHYNGIFPVWLSPIQVILLPITNRVYVYAKEVEQLMRIAGLRIELNNKQETLNYKIREAQLQKVPYIVIIGDIEVKNRTISTRLRNNTELKNITINSFIDLVKNESRIPTTK